MQFVVRLRQIRRGRSLVLIYGSFSALPTETKSSSPVASAPNRKQTEDMTTEHSHRPRTLAEYLGIVRRRKWLAIVPLLVVPLAAYLYSSQQPAVFAASSEVLLSRQDLGSVLSGNTNSDVFTDADRFAQTQAALARVPGVAERAVARAGVAVSPGELLGNSSVAPRGNADLLSFTVEDRDPAVAAKLSAAYAQAYTSYRVELDTAALANARKDLERSLAALRRQGATNTELYRDISGKAQELRTMELLQGRAEVVRMATSGAQIAPTPRRSAILGLGLGLLLGLAAVLLWEALDRRVRDEEEIHRTLQIPLLARLPAPRRQGLAMLDDPSDVDAEAIRRLRSSVEFANLDVNAKVLMVTSCVGEEGKTTTISNLAVALARGGHRVALVDMDLRKPMVGRFFGLGLRPGLADVAIERVELEQALVPTRLRTSEPITFARPQSTRLRRAAQEESGSSMGDGEGRLFVLPAGFLPASPGELVGTRAVAGILEQLREHMDFVLVDAPPMLTVSDAATLSRRVDALVVVVRLGRVNRPMLRDLARELEASPARKLGFVLAGADATELYGVDTYSYLSKGEANHQQTAAAARGYESEVADSETYADERSS